VNRGIFIFGLWCLLVTLGFAYASFSGYSPFADGQRASGAGPGGVFIRRGAGPRHK